MAQCGEHFVSDNRGATGRAADMIDSVLRHSR
jgi:hypothetical protein